MFRTTGKRCPTQITEADLDAWCTATGANNTVRNRLSTVRRFFGWCLRKGIVAVDRPSTSTDSASSSRRSKESSAVAVRPTIR